jgi:hypothetical protein
MAIEIAVTPKGDRPDAPDCPRRAFPEPAPLALAAPPALADTGTASITHPARLAGSAVAQALAGAAAHHSTDARAWPWPTCRSSIRLIASS